MNPWKVSARLLAQVLFVALLCTLTPATYGKEPPNANLESEKRLRKDVVYLASKKLEGRGTQTKGLELAAEYVAKQFRAAGLKPGNGKSYFQPFEIAPSILKDGTQFLIKGPQGQTIKLKIGDHFNVMGFSGNKKANAPLVFVGYGITAPDVKYDDYKDIDVEGKIVVLIRRTPRYRSKLGFDGRRKSRHADLISRMNNALKQKAAGFILVNDDYESNDKLTEFKQLVQAKRSIIPAVHVKRSVVDDILRSSANTTLTAIEKAIDRDLKPRSMALNGWSATIHTTTEGTKVKNVIGYLPGSGPLAKEYVVVGGHYDHLGYGERGSRARSSKLRKQIHFGADDNASGTTGVMELARRFAKKSSRERRTLVFMAFSAEEKGLLGSDFYCSKQPLFPLDKTFAMLNLDMIGRMSTDKKTNQGNVLVQGVGTAKEFDTMLERFNKRYNFKFTKSPGGNGPSDHNSFFLKDIPVLFLWTGVHQNYHLPTDTAERINYKDMVRLVNLAENVATYFATTKESLQFVKAINKGFISRPGAKAQTASRSKVRLRFAPDYAYQGSDGMRISFVVPGGPAAKAGLKAGDRIVEIQGERIRSVSEYSTVINKQPKGTVLTIKFIRNKKEMTVKASPIYQ
ncbi:MAG: M28 family peptidase [Gemmataceae bacterium]